MKRKHQRPKTKRNRAGQFSKARRAPSARPSARRPARTRARVPPRVRASTLRAGKRRAADYNLFAVELQVPPREQLEKFLNALRSGMLHANALMTAGLTWRPISYLLCYDKDFKKSYKEARAEGIEVDRMLASDQNRSVAIDGVKEVTTTVLPKRGGIEQKVRVYTRDSALRRELHRTAPGVYEPLPAGAAGGGATASDWDEAIAEAERRRAAEEAQSKPKPAGTKPKET